MRRHGAWVIVALTLTALTPGGASAAPSPGPSSQPVPIHLQSRTFTPAPGFTGIASFAASPRHGLIQFHSLPTHSDRLQLSTAGVTLLTYVPNRAFLAALPTHIQPLRDIPIVRAVIGLRDADKIEPRILATGVSPAARAAGGYVRMNVLFFGDVPAAEARAAIQARQGRVTEALPAFGMLRVLLPEAQLRRLLADDRVQWVDETLPPELLNAGARAASNVDPVQAPPYGLSGNGVRLGEWDGGYPMAPPPSSTLYHQDLLGRVVLGDTETPFDNAHATHVAGTALGSGLLTAAVGGPPFGARGMAPRGTVVSYFLGGWLSEYAGAINTHNIDLATNSWGHGFPSTYTADNRGADQVIAGLHGKRIPIVWAAGNSRGRDPATGRGCLRDLDGNWMTFDDSYACIITEAAGKNTITVGATNSNDDSMPRWSSWGPVGDGRLKPEVVVPGCQVGGDGGIVSPVPVDTYASACGTSMSAPGVAGSTMLLYERYDQVCSPTDRPLPSTMKALIAHGARDLDDATPWYNRGPDFSSGYGHLDAKQSVDMLPFHLEDAVGHGAVKEYPIQVAAQKDLKVTLAWDDPAAAPNSAIALVNDLDLELVDPSGTVHRPWVLDPANPRTAAARGIDSLNPVEQVVVDNVTLAMAGTWKIRVKGKNVPAPNQRFSVVSELLKPCASPTQADVWGADTTADTGVEPHSVPSYWSNDIRVQATPVDDGSSINPRAGQNNYVFVTVRNRGTAPAKYARVFAYQANASTALHWPVSWTQIGAVTAVDVAPGASTVVGPILWVPAGTGHYCLYVRMVTSNDPTGPETANVGGNTMNNNAIIWRNMTVVAGLAQGPTSSTFIARNGERTSARFDLRFREAAGQLDDLFLDHGRVVVDIGDLAPRIGRSGVRTRGMVRTGRSRFRIVDPRNAAILGFPLGAKQAVKIGIRFSGSDIEPGDSYRYDVIQERAARGARGRPSGRRRGTQIGGVGFELSG